jgi:ankyrin repeat protein
MFCSGSEFIKSVPRKTVRVLGSVYLFAVIIFLPCCRKDGELKNQDKANVLRPIDADFLEACKEGDLNKVKQCLGQGADILVRSDYRTALFSAIDSGSMEVIEFLLEKEKKLVSVPDQYGVKPLGYIVRGYGNFKSGAEKTDRLAALNLLINAGANVDETDDYGYGLTEIFYAAGKFAPDIVEALLQGGAQLNPKTCAAYFDSFFDVDFTLPPGSTPLDKYEALLEVIPALRDFEDFRKIVLEIIQVLKKHGAVNGAWASSKKRPHHGSIN